MTANNSSNGQYDPVAEVLNHVKGVVETPNGYDAFCPNHEPDGETGGRIGKGGADAQAQPFTTGPL